MISTIFRDKANPGKFTEKAATLVVKISKGEKSKSVGMVALNLANYISFDEKAKVNTFKRERFPIERCPDKDSFLELEMRSTLISATAGSEAMSLMSGFDNMSIDSGPDSEFNFAEMESQQEKMPEQQDIEGGFEVKKPSGAGAFRRRFITAGKRPSGKPTMPEVEEKKEEDVDISQINKEIAQEIDKPPNPKKTPLIKIDKSKIKLLSSAASSSELRPASALTVVPDRIPED
mmetsp:Transcript_38978/g.59266  ORF Transcript_38978/g.59266 Transcript_38978/m.59266 type:complete len:233 (+) Transcript_38978:223-921(+)|eukprot:CAMPEP_0170511416 /NCGR_PEP_ID=MMETSP0208-20121228/66290_1 /TAXON_ID=197538 /ORGANISM="Strombidium inclinatum, Strain S3" /LENGTH=232 /DNA_ID=CAMNT_0010794957 /DNA_START=223 /DNA_END=921 /DNA_ORIENTATION=-